MATSYYPIIGKNGRLQGASNAAAGDTIAIPSGLKFSYDGVEIEDAAGGFGAKIKVTDPTNADAVATLQTVLENIEDAISGANTFTEIWKAGDSLADSTLKLSETAYALRIHDDAADHDIDDATTATYLEMVDTSAANLFKMEKTGADALKFSMDDVYDLATDGTSVIRSSKKKILDDCGIDSSAAVEQSYYEWRDSSNNQLMQYGQTADGANDMALTIKSGTGADSGILLNTWGSGHAIKFLDGNAQLYSTAGKIEMEAVNGYASNVLAYDGGDINVQTWGTTYGLGNIWLTSVAGDMQARVTAANARLGLRASGSGAGVGIWATSGLAMASAREANNITVTAAADITTGDYFLLDAPHANYYVWFNKDSGGGDPAPAGRTAIPVAIAAADDLNTVRDAVIAAVGAVHDFQTYDDGDGVVEVYNILGGVGSMVDGNTGFSISNISTGADGVIFGASELKGSSTLTVNPEAGNLNLKVADSASYYIDVAPTSGSYTLISNVKDPVSNQDAATKKYCLDNFVELGGDTMTGALDMGANKITSTYVPANAADLVNKLYADSIAAGIKAHAPVAVASTANLTLSGEQTIDGVLTSASRILVKDQTDASENGIYITDASSWSRASDFDNSPSGEVAPGDYVFVQSGTANQNTGWVITVFAGTIDTDDMDWGQFSFAGHITAGDGLDQDGTTITVDVTDLLGTGLTESDNNIVVSYGSSAGTACQGSTTFACSAGSGLTGGQASAALGGGISFSLAVGAGDGIDVADDAVAVDITDLLASGAGIKDDGSNNLQIELEDSNPTLKITTNALGVKYDSNSFGTGASGLALAANVAGDALDLATGQLSVDITDLLVSGAGIKDDGSNNLQIELESSDPTLKITTNALGVKYDSNSFGTGASGLALAANAAGDGLDLATGQLSVDVTDLLGTGLTESDNNIVVSYGSSAGTACQGSTTFACTAGNGLTGGQASAALGGGISFSLAVGAGDGISVSADAIAVNTDSIKRNFATANDPDLNAGQLLAYNATDKIGLADADDTDPPLVIGFAAAAHDDDNDVISVYNVPGTTITIADGTYVDSESALTAGVWYYASGTAGNITKTEPATGHIYRVGYALSTTELLYMPQHIVQN